MKVTIANKGVLLSLGSLVEQAITVVSVSLQQHVAEFRHPPKTADLDLFRPDAVVESTFPGLVQHDAIIMVGDTLQPEEDLNSHKAEADRDANTWNDPDPLLPGIFLV